MAHQILERADSVRMAWKIAFDKGYFLQAIIDYAAPDFVQFLGGLIPGLLMALMLPILGVPLRSLELSS